MGLIAKILTWRVTTQTGRMCLKGLFVSRRPSHVKKKGKRKVQGVLHLQTAALPRPQEEEETDKSKQAQTEQTYEKH